MAAAIPLPPFQQMQGAVVLPTDLDRDDAAGCLQPSFRLALNPPLRIFCIGMRTRLASNASKPKIEFRMGDIDGCPDQVAAARAA